jgi:hypothetical protein
VGSLTAFIGGQSDGVHLPCDHMYVAKPIPPGLMRFSYGELRKKGWCLVRALSSARTNARLKSKQYEANRRLRGLRSMALIRGYCIKPFAPARSDL